MRHGEYHEDTGGTGGHDRLSRAQERLKGLVLKPPDPTKTVPAAPPRSAEELEHRSHFADDKERLVGLVAAPLAAAIALMINGALIANDPAARLKNGLANAKHVNPSLYNELMLALVALAVVMLATAWFRKRLFLGCAMALYGLAVFNLHYWGFGVPYVLFGAWLLVHAYRAQRDYKEAAGTPRARGRSAATSLVAVPSASKRYTPPSPARRPPGAKAARTTKERAPVRRAV